MSLPYSRGERGFTLIELMITVTVIGILAVVAIPKFTGMLERSREATVMSNLGKLRSSIAVYYADHDGTYPGNLQDALSPEYLTVIPAVAIPSTSLTSNPGHAESSGVLQGAEGGAGDGGPVWFYVDQGLSMGRIMVNCSHFDSRGNMWTSQ